MVSQEQVQRLAAMAVDTGGLSGTTNHQFYGSHKSVQSFYNEYYGLEDFDGVPISGGLHTMAEKFRAKWRKSVRGGAKHMSELKAVMRAIADMTALERGSVDGSFGELDDVFQDKGVDGGKKRLSNLVDILKKQGIVASATREGWASASV
jgi:hypothetical protein